MSKIGTIEEVLNNDEKELWGYIRTLTFDLNFQMARNPDRNGMNSPDYLISTKSLQGHLVPIGVAWLKKPKRYGSDQSDFLSITFDDPSFIEPLNVAAFIQDDGKNWNVTWRRRQERASNSEAA
jgi:uncharacterized protein (DUF736 family)